MSVHATAGILLIVNPASGSGRGRSSGQRAASALRSAGARCDLRVTERPGHATEIAGTDAGEYDVVAAVGGDGTLLEVVRGLTAPDVKVGVIPVGTANVVARELAIPRGSPEAAAGVLLGGEPRVFDLPFVGDRPFLANAGVGFDADVVHAVHGARTDGTRSRRFGMTSWIPIGLRCVRDHGPAELVVTIDDERLDGTFADVVVCNTANYGGLFSLTPDARPDDALLDVYCRRRDGLGGILRHLASALLRWEDPAKTCRRRGRRVEVLSREPAAVQVDGDPAGTTPLEVVLDGRRLAFMAPKGRNDDG